MNDYLITDIAVITGYIYTHLKNPTPIRVQKTLYFIWAFYAAGYGQLANQDISINTKKPMHQYPKQLYPSEFKALKYGPINQTVSDWQSLGPEKMQQLPAELVQAMQTDEKTVQIEIKSFIDDVIGQSDNIYDYGLVLRSQKDHAWQVAYQNKTSNVMLEAEIIADYQKYILTQN